MDAVAVLEVCVFGPDAWSTSSVASELAGGDRFAVVATEDDEVVGYAVTMRSGDTVDLQRIAVHPSRRRQGTAVALLGAVTDRALDDGAAGMLLEVGSQNRAALGLYGRSGFVEVGRRRRYFRDGSDASVMEWKP
ncbi:MAG: GNAT family N-acetyltransferase [Actinomycetota bacterium]|nr:GNAT family N-acetyltransferase [Actinomycetota bacterium]